jgi:hypothetical protein
MLRIGGKCKSEVLEPFRLRTQQTSSRPDGLSKSEQRRLCSRKHERNSHEHQRSELRDRPSTPLTWVDIFQFLTQICPYELDAFPIPEIGDGFMFVRQDGNAIQPDYLFDQWYRGRTPEGPAHQTKLRL